MVHAPAAALRSCVFTASRESRRLAEFGMSERRLSALRVFPRGAFPRDTAEHHEIFGDDGECVLYVRNHSELVKKARCLLADDRLREKLANAAHARISGGGNRYRDRLEGMIHA